MTNIDFKKIPWSFKINEITISEKDVPFDTDYNVISPTNGNKHFKFTHSTGPEFDKDTKWIYVSEDGIRLAVCNDTQMVKVAAENYLKAKLRKG